MTKNDTVHTQALQDKTQRVILVVRDKEVIADKESMEEDLQRYISLNTYLDCEDPWFWQKLRFVKCVFISFLFQAHVYVWREKTLLIKCWLSQGKQ